MATQVVELTGDEANLLRALDKVIQKERDHERALGRMADAGDQAGLQIEDAMTRVERANQEAIKSTIKELSKLGPEGKRVSEALNQGFREIGAGGLPGADDLLKKISSLDPATAAVVERVKSQLAEADRADAYDKTLAAMKQLGGESAEVAKEIQSQLKSTDTSGAFQQYYDDLIKLDPTAKDIADKVRVKLAEADRADAYDKTLAAMKQLGGESAEVAKEIQSRLAAAGNAPGAFDGYLAELAKLDPAAREVASDVRKRLADADRQTEFNNTLKSLRELGPAGKKIADEFSANMKTSAAEAAGGLDAVIQKMKSFDPTIESLAEKIKRDLADADAATKFDDSIRELEKINPEAAKAARKIREEMNEADAAVKFDNIITELRKIDPVAADEAAKLRAHMTTAAKSGTKAWTGFAASAVTQIGAVAGAYLGIQEAIQAVNSYLAEQESLLQSALDKQLELAKAQQEASKNLAAFSAVERDQLLQEAVPEIARETGFADVAQLTLALGTAASKGATPQEARNAVAAAARADRLTPDTVDETAAGAISVQKQTGLIDARQAIALIQTTGTQSAVVDPKKLVENLPKALGGVSTVRGQNPEEASRQVAALFSAITKGGNDSEGNSSATFSLSFTNNLEKLFGDLANQQIDARSKIVRTENKKVITEADLRDVQELKDFLKETENLKDPGSIFGRIDFLQKNEATREKFVGAGFGEAQFQVVLKELVSSQSQGNTNLREAFDAIQASTSFFETQASAQERSTPQLIIANAVSQQAANVAATDAANTGGGALQTVRDIVVQTLGKNRADGMQGFGQSLGETGISRGSLGGSGVTAEAISGIQAIRSRIDSIASDGITTAEQPKVVELQSSIKTIESLILGLIETGAIDPAQASAAATEARRQSQVFADVSIEGAQNEKSQFTAEMAGKIEAALVKQNELMATQNELLAAQSESSKKTAENTAPKPERQPDYAAINAAAASQGTSR